MIDYGVLNKYFLIESFIVCTVECPLTIYFCLDYQLESDKIKHISPI